MARVFKLKKTIDVAAEAVSIAFAHGATLTTSLKDLTPEIIRRLALFGLSEKLGNTNAGVTDSSEGEKIMKAAYENLKQGIFNAARSSGESAPRISMLIEALVRVSAQSPDIPTMDAAAATGFVESLSEEQVKALRAIPEVKLAIKEIGLERARKEAEDAKASGGGLASFLK